MMMSSQHQRYMAVHKVSVEVALHQIHRANFRAQFHHSAFFTIASMDAMFFKCNTQSQYFTSTCVRRTFYFVCSVRFLFVCSVRTFLFAACGFILFAACGFFVCSVRMYFVCSVRIFCLQRADFFICSVRTFLFAVCGFILFAACGFFYLQRADLFCSQCIFFLRCVTFCYMEEYYQERCVPYRLP